MTTNNELGKYKIKQNSQIGQGFSGVVMGCENTESPNQKLCAKMIDKNQQKYSIREKVISEALKKHFQTYKNLVQIVDIIDTPKNVVIIQELCEKDLEYIMKVKEKQNIRFSLQECIDIIRQIINGYRKLIYLSLIHRDLKPQNILYKDGYYKITDFGFARIVDSVEEQKKYTQLGTPLYFSPQILLGQQYSNKTDIYSLGLIFYRLIFGKDLYEINQQKEMIQKSQNEPIQIEMIEGMTNELKLLIENMLKFDESDRIGWQDLIKHPLINLDSQCILKKWRKEDRLENIEFQSERDINLSFTIKFLQYNFYLTILFIKNLKEQTILIENELSKNILFLIKCLLEHILYGKNDSINKFIILQEQREVEVIEEVYLQQMVLENQNETEQIQPDEGVYISQIQQIVYKNRYLFCFDKQQIYYKEHLQILYFLQKIMQFQINKFINFYKFCKQIQIDQKNQDSMESYLEKIFN